MQRRLKRLIWIQIICWFVILLHEEVRRSSELMWVFFRDVKVPCKGIVWNEGIEKRGACLEQRNRKQRNGLKRRNKRADERKEWMKMDIKGWLKRRNKRRAGLEQRGTKEVMKVDINGCLPITRIKTHKLTKTRYCLMILHLYRIISRFVFFGTSILLCI